MEPGLILAGVAAVTFTLGTSLIRKGNYLSGESFTSVFISAFVGLLFFAIAVSFNAEWDRIWFISWRGLWLLATGGIVHFVIGRFLAHNTLRLIGANKATAIMRTQIIYPVVLGITILKEPFTVFLFLGVLCVIVGATLAGMEKKDKVLKTYSYKGVIAGFLAAIFWGVSGVMLKPGIEEIGSPYAAAFISYAAAALVIGAIAFGDEHRKQIKQLQGRTVIILLLSSIFTAIAQLLRYSALEISRVSVVDALILSINGLFILLVSFIINRRIEVFTWKVFLGTAATITGVYLLFL